METVETYYLLYILISFPLSVYFIMIIKRKWFENRESKIDKIYEAELKKRSA